MRPLFVLLTITLGSLLTLSSCSDSTTTTDPNKPGDTTSASDSSYGDAAVRIDRYTKFTMTDNFFCYDTRDSTFRIQLYGQDYLFAFIFHLDELKAGQFTYPSGKCTYSISIPGHGSAGETTSYEDSIYFTILKMNPTEKRFSAVISAQFHKPISTLTAIDSILIEEAGFIIYPTTSKPSMSLMIGGIRFPGDKPSAITSEMNSLGVPSWMFRTSVGASTDVGYKTFSINISPTNEGAGTYPLPGRVYLNYLTGVYDSVNSVTNYVSYTTKDGTLEVKSYDKKKGLISGTFSGTVKNYTTGEELSITDGVFTNIFLEPF